MTAIGNYGNTNPRMESNLYFRGNELFNTAVAQRVFIVTQKGGKNMLDNEDGIQMISANDFRTGRRYVRNLETIQVRRAV